MPEDALTTLRRSMLSEPDHADNMFLPDAPKIWE